MPRQALAKGISVNRFDCKSYNIQSDIVASLITEKLSYLAEGSKFWESSI